MAVESSADSYINAQPEEVMDFNSFYNNYGRNKYGDWVDADPDHWFTQIANFFTGDVNTARNLYDAYLTNTKNKNEFISAQSARAWDKMIDDTKYQREMRDLQAAGLNPYLLINGNGLSASSYGSSAKANYDTHSRTQKQSSGKGRDFALILLAAARIAAALM